MSKIRVWSTFWGKDRTTHPRNIFWIKGALQSAKGWDWLSDAWSKSKEALNIYHSLQISYRVDVQPQTVEACLRKRAGCSSKNQGSELLLDFCPCSTLPVPYLLFSLRHPNINSKCNLSTRPKILKTWFSLPVPKKLPRTEYCMLKGLGKKSRSCLFSHLLEPYRLKSYLYHKMLQVDTSFHVWLRQHYYLHKRKIWVVKITEASRINVAFTVLRAALRLLGRSTDLQPERCSTVLYDTRVCKCHP